GTDGFFEAVFISEPASDLLPPPPMRTDYSCSIREFVRIPDGKSAAPGIDLRAAWKQAIRRSLPEYMVPSEWVLLEQFPLTENNKIDRKALPIPARLLHERQDEQKPMTANEKWAAAIWSEVLKIEKIGPEDDFFELGGHSLLAVELMTRLEKEFNISLPLTSLFKHATLTDFATLLDGKFETE